MGGGVHSLFHLSQFSLPQLNMASLIQLGVLDLAGSCIGAQEYRGRATHLKLIIWDLKIFAT